MSVSSRLAALQRAADALARGTQRAKAAPTLLVLTDPQRTPDVIDLALNRLPCGAGLVYRHFGAPEAERIAGRLAEIARRRELVLLVGADAALAQRCGAHGVHLPERLVGEAVRLRARWPRALITTAAHGARALRKAREAGANAALLSAVFPSRSPSAGLPWGATRAAALVRGAGLPVYALGGVDVRTVSRLRGVGVCGMAVVGAAGFTPP